MVGFEEIMKRMPQLDIPDRERDTRYKGDLEI